jgi:DNA adenine methylase
MQYLGGKFRIAKPIADYINNYSCIYDIYVEPFCGAVNVASRVAIKNKLLNDKHPYLIEMFKALQDGWIPPDGVTEEEYNFVKCYQDLDPHISGFVGFGCAFGGKFFRGYARGSQGYALAAKNSILKKMETLKDAEFTCKDFLELDYANCLIYCDPPYPQCSGYNRKLLGVFPQDKFENWVKEQSLKNLVLVSTYKQFCPKDVKIVLEIKANTNLRNSRNKCIGTTEIVYRY